MPDTMGEQADGSLLIPSRVSFRSRVWNTIKSLCQHREGYHCRHRELLDLAGDRMKPLCSMGQCPVLDSCVQPLATERTDVR